MCLEGCVFVCDFFFFTERKEIEVEGKREREKGGYRDRHRNLLELERKMERWREIQRA